MDIGQSFTYIADDENWVQKIGLGAVIGMVPILNFATFGYQVKIARNVAQGEERLLPAWDDLGTYFVDGLRLIAAMFVYMLPAILIYMLAFGGVFAFSFAADSGTYDPSRSGSFLEMLPLMAMGLSMMCIMPYSLLIWILYPMFFIQIARRGTVKSCFDFREMWSLVRAQPVNYIIVLAIMFGLYMVISFALMPVYLVAAFIPCIGFIFTMMISGAVMILVGAVSGHLEGQFILEGNNLGLSKTGGKEPV
jgi:hypothetical protein